MTYWDARAEECGAAAAGLSGDKHDEADMAFLKAFEIVEPCDVLVDFGCGVGRLYSVLSSKCKVYIGVDSSRKMLDIFHDTCPLKPTDQIIERPTYNGPLPLPDNCVDTIVCSVVLQHILDSDAFLFTITELKRILKKGGKFYLCEAMTEGIVANQPFPEFQRLRTQEMYEQVFLPEIPLEGISTVWGTVHKMLVGTKQEVFVSGEVILDIGCGRNKIFNAIGVDRRIAYCYGEQVTDIISDAESGFLPFRDKSLDQVHLNNVLEHFANPYPPLLEIHRILKDDGGFICEVPYPGTASSDGDPTHKMVLSPDQWLNILNGFFLRVIVAPIGFRFRGVESRWRRWQEKLLSLGFWEMAQGGRFRCETPRHVIEFRYVPWWLENYVRKIAGEDML
jgi:ubiquinone/menaquinone biosynthesis C-methylase UbiE